MLNAPKSVILEVIVHETKDVNFLEQLDPRINKFGEEQIILAQRRCHWYI